VLSHAGLNATLNAASACLLATGYFFIRTGHILAHKTCMVFAFFSSSVFLGSYLLYHARVGSVRFQGHGWIRPFYFTLLTSHTLLAAAIVPLAILTLSRAVRGQFDRHRTIARWTFPIWLYVSVTGVVVYILLYHIYAPAKL